MTLGTVVRTRLVTMMTLCAGKNAVVLSMRIALCLILRHCEFVHFVVVTVASNANVSVINLFEHGRFGRIMTRSTRQMIFFNVSVC